MRALLLLFVVSFTAVTQAAQQTFHFKAYELPKNGRLVVPVTQSDQLQGTAAKVNEATNGAIARAAIEAEFTGEKGKTLTLFGTPPYARIDLIGLGEGPIDRNATENFGGSAAVLLADVRGGEINILWQLDDAAVEATAARVAFGYELRSYRFDRYQKDRTDASTLPAVHILSDDNSAEQYVDDLAHLAEGVFLARDMSSEPANIIYPESFVERVQDQFKGIDNVQIKVLDEKDLQKLGMGAHWGVGKGSARPPRLLIIEYLAGGDKPLTVLAGKGITFDTGGISIKKNDGMWAMKGDLGGAGVVSGSVLAAAKRGASINVVALAALAENMPSGNATRPGDILTTMAGITVEILSTDAEGRLVLSDAVHYAQQTYNPDVLIDVATLTGSVGRALGDEYAGIFGRHDNLIEQISAASTAANEAVWRLPLDASHFKQIESDFADIKNSGAGSPGASAGAAFIGSFIDEDQVWAHLDIAGVDLLTTAQATVPKGYSGWGVRTLDEYLRRHPEH
ncbi:MAG: leucyl aminopeptidase [Candidatus Azotimanducaceae bacterium]|jgi:leucyl aminopeptidase